MAIFGIWAGFGFADNPYGQETLTADELGDYLLVGRDPEVGELQRRIGSAGSFPSIEGPVGVGKSSLLEVAVYRMAQVCIKQQERELYLPAVSRFQPENDVDQFEARIFRVIAQTLIRYADTFEIVDLDRPDVKKLDHWLNDPQFKTWSGQASFIAGAGMGRGTTANSAEGFAKSGFPEAVREVLRASFPQGTGGIVCVLDNLELVETAGAARKALDELRDRVFNLPGVRWVLCGSRGIVSRARTERLSGIFQAPMTIGPLDDKSVVEAIARRIERFKIGDDARAPVTPVGFEFLYRALNHNLRDALATAQEFSQWLYTDFIVEGRPVPDDDERTQFLESWLADRAEQAHKDATTSGVQARNWQFFEDLCSRGGRAGSADFEGYGFNVQQQLSSAVTQLVNANLLVREVDPDNGSRTVNAVTAIGWLVHFYRDNFKLPAGRQAAKGS